MVDDFIMVVSVEDIQTFEDRFDTVQSLFSYIPAEGTINNTWILHCPEVHRKIV